MNKFDEMRAGVLEAEIILRAADSLSTEMAGLLVGRLKKVRNYRALESLKRELKDFNIRTGDWKNP